MNFFDKEAFISKVSKLGFNIFEPEENVYSEISDFVFSISDMFGELPNLDVSYVYDDKKKAGIIISAIPISEMCLDNSAHIMSEKLNSLTPSLYTEVQGAYFTSQASIEFSKLSYSNNDEGLELAASFVLFFYQEFVKYHVNAYKFISTGNISYLS